MTCTIVAQVVDELGAACWRWRDRWGGDHVERIGAHPAASFDDQQPRDIPISVGHDGPFLGEVAYLEHGLSNPDLYAVGILDDVDVDEVDGLYCSAELQAFTPPGTLIAERCQLTGLALVGVTAGVGARRVQAFPGDVRNRGAWSSSTTPDILTRCAAAIPARWSRRRAPLHIHRPFADGLDTRVMGRSTGQMKQVTNGYGHVETLEVEHFNGGHVLGVR